MGVRKHVCSGRCEDLERELKRLAREYGKSEAALTRERGRNLALSMRVAGQEIGLSGDEKLAVAKEDLERGIKGAIGLPGPGGYIVTPIEIDGVEYRVEVSR